MTTNILSILHYQCGFNLTAISRMSKVNPTKDTVRKWVKSGAETPQRLIDNMYIPILVEWGRMANRKDPTASLLWTAIFPHNPKPHIYHILAFRMYVPLVKLAEWSEQSDETIYQIMRYSRISKRQLRRIARRAMEISESKQFRDTTRAAQVYNALRDHKRLTD